MSVQPTECAQCELSDGICEACEREARIQKHRADVSARQKRVNEEEDKSEAQAELKRQREEFARGQGLSSGSKSSPPKKIEQPAEVPTVTTAAIAECDVAKCCDSQVRQGLCQTCLIALGFWEKNGRVRHQCPMRLTDEQVIHFNRHFP